MATFVALAPPDGDLEKTVFVRDGFTWLAFLVPALWFLFHRMWIEALLAFAVTLLLGSLDAAGGAAGPLLSLLFGLLVGLEAPVLRLWALRRRGWTERGAFEADNAAEAEIRYFHGAEAAPSAAAREPAPPTVQGSGRAAVPALGFLDYRGRA